MKVKNLLDEGIAAKEFRSDLQTDIIVLGILGLCNWSYLWFDAEGAVSDEIVCKIYTEMIINGLHLSPTHSISFTHSSSN